MRILSCRVSEQFVEDLTRHPLDQIKVKARMRNHKVEMKVFNNRVNEWYDISKVDRVMIDWGHASKSGHASSDHLVVMTKINRVIVDEIGDVEGVVTNTEAFIEIETVQGIKMLIPLYDSDLYLRVTAVKWKG